MRHAPAGAEKALLCRFGHWKFLIGHWTFLEAALGRPFLLVFLYKRSVFCRFWMFFAVIAWCAKMTQQFFFQNNVLSRVRFFFDVPQMV